MLVILTGYDARSSWDRRVGTVTNGDAVVGETDERKQRQRVMDTILTGSEGTTVLSVSELGGQVSKLHVHS